MRCILILLACTAVLVGCQGEFIPSGKIVHQMDGAVRDEKTSGLNFKVTRFEWHYLAPTDQVKIDGWAENLSSEPVDSCRIIANIYDQFDYPLATSEAYVSPTYLAPGQIGRFEFFVQRGKWVKAIHMTYRFETRY